MQMLGTMSVELFVAIVFALINLQIQIRLMSWWWAKGCTWQQFLDIYDLGSKHKNWMLVDMITNSVIMVTSSLILYSLGWVTSPVWLGIIGVSCVEGLAIAHLPFRFAGARYAVRNNPNLLDFNGKYKGTHNEYKKLVMLLE